MTEVCAICGRFKMLDCFCGMGGVSDGFAMEGFDVIGIDIVDTPKLLGYKHKFIQADMMMLKGEDFRGFDVIWGSPPCRDFSQLAHVGNLSLRKNSVKWAWKNPPNIHRGLMLVHAFLAVVQEAQPKIWIMENVLGLVNYLFLKPIQISKIQKTKKRAFWGNFPSFLMPCEVSENLVKGIWHIQGKNRSWKRAKIPLSCSRAFAQACKQKLLEG